MAKKAKTGMIASATNPMKSLEPQKADEPIWAPLRMRPIPRIAATQTIETMTATKLGVEFERDWRP